MIMCENKSENVSIIHFVFSSTQFVLLLFIKFPLTSQKTI